MKQRIFIFGLITFMVILLGAIFKVNHWPAAGIMLTAGLGTFVLVFIPLGLVSSYRSNENKRNKLLYITTGVTCFIVFTAMLFKFQHWPYAGLLLPVAIIFPYIVFLPVYLFATSKDKNYSIYKTVFVLFLVVVNSVFGAMLTLSVTRERINDSLNLARNYNKAETALFQFPVKDLKSPVSLKIDEVLKIVDEYREVILKGEGLTAAEWKEDPGKLWRPESNQVASRALENAGDSPAGTKLYNGLKSLLSEIEKTPGCEILAKAAPALLDLVPDEQGQTNTTRWNMSINLAWSLIYLDDIETDLLMVRTTLDSVN